MYPEWAINIGYDIDDLLNGIQYCQEYLDAGYKYEYMDGFDLQAYIDWAKYRIKTW
jgi:hypothetical protein